MPRSPDYERNCDEACLSDDTVPSKFREYICKIPFSERNGWLECKKRHADKECLSASLLGQCRHLGFRWIKTGF